MNLSERDKAVIWHPYTQAQTAAPVIPIIAAEGTYLIDENGKRYIDAISSWWVNLHGHSHPYIAEEVSPASQKTGACYFCRLYPRTCCTTGRATVGNSARRAIESVLFRQRFHRQVEVALKMAFQYWKNKGVDRSGIIAFRSAYHGDTFGAMSVSERTAFTAPFNDKLFDVPDLLIRPLKAPRKNH